MAIGDWDYFKNMFVPSSPLGHQTDAFKYLVQSSSPSILPSKELPLPPVNSRDKWAKEMLMMRLDTILRQKWMRDGDFVTCHHMQDSGMVVTFYCFGADTGVVEDEQELFPSDALISQLRLLRK